MPGDPSRARTARRGLRALGRRAVRGAGGSAPERAARPATPSCLYRSGKAYLRLAQWSYERIRAIDPKSARLSQALGREIPQQGRVDEAIRAVQEAARPRPALPGIHLALAQLLASQPAVGRGARRGRPGAGARAGQCGGARPQGPHRGGCAPPRSSKRHGAMCRRLVARLSACVASARAAVRARPADAARRSVVRRRATSATLEPRRGAGARRSDKAINAQDWPRAEQLLAAEIERTPKPAALLKLLAACFMHDRKPLNAAIALKKAEAIGPLDAALALPARARVHRHAPRRLGASRARAGSSAAEPQNTSYLYWLGRLDYDSGKYASAVARLQQVIAREPGFIRAYDNLGLCYEALNQPDDAMAPVPGGDPTQRALLGETWPWPFLNLGILLRNGRRARGGRDAVPRGARRSSRRSRRRSTSSATVLEYRIGSTRPCTLLERAAAADPVLRRAALRALAHLPPPGRADGGRRRAGDLRAAARADAGAEAVIRRRASWPPCWPRRSGRDRRRRGAQDVSAGSSPRIQAALERATSRRARRLVDEACAAHPTSRRCTTSPA